jgi:hypothetical protein
VERVVITRHTGKIDRVRLRDGSRLAHKNIADVELVKSETALFVTHCYLLDFGISLISLISLKRK